MSSLFSKWGWGGKKKDQKREIRALIVGLDRCGKTVLVSRIKYGDVVDGSFMTIPTTGFNVESVDFDANVGLTLWDVGGDSKIRALWKTYATGLGFLVYVIDSSDRSRLMEAKDALCEILSHVDPFLPLLVFANKQDISMSMDAAEVAVGLGLGMLGERKHFVQLCSAINGSGLNEGLAWAVSQVTAPLPAM